jgi:RimJ/RimL family protein N-acetyltransferase
VEGVVEVGYSIMPAYWGQGFASEAVAHFVEWAFAHSDVNVVTAQTLPQLRATGLAF